MNTVNIGSPSSQQQFPLSPAGLSTYTAKYFPVIITAIFFILSFIGVLHHHPWRDEFQAWLVARDAHSLLQLHQNLKYEGHPIVYYLFLYVITSFSHNPFWMQLFCICISVLFIFLINRYSPFPLVFKILITFGYYTFFEYNLISRSYGLGFLLVVIFCILYKNRYRYYLPIAIVLFVMANVNSYAMLLSVNFAGLLFLDYLFNRKLSEVPKISFATILTCAILLIAGWVLAAWQILPAPDNSMDFNFAGKTLDLSRVRTALILFFDGIYALPDFRNPNYWNTNFFEKVSLVNGVWTTEGTPLWPVLTILIFSLYFIRKPLVLFLYMVGTMSLLYFIYYTFFVWQRYLGHFFVLLFACMWLNYYYRGFDYKNKIMALISSFGKQAGYSLFAIVLFIGFIGGTGCYYKGLTTTFSTSYLAADYLKKNKLDKLEMVGAVDYTILPIAALLDRKIYYPNERHEGSFPVFDKERKYGFALGELSGYLHERKAKGAQKIIVITSFQAASDDFEIAADKPVTDFMLAPGIHMHLIQFIASGVVADEQYYIYLVEKE